MFWSRSWDSGLSFRSPSSPRWPGKIDEIRRALPWLIPLLRYSAFSLGAMLVTGILLDIAANGAFHGSWWFRGSALLLVATGALHGQARRTVRVSLAEKANSDTVLRRLERLAFAMCILIAGISVLMEVKPF